ncbi:MAG: glycosyl transferase family 1 [Gammaproteobacteria bacterium]|nr:MAG: glycosyl transferase family 1 [Gammaproteobacteria bacterium]
MKILYHHRIRSKDGQYVHLEALVRALEARGHEVILVGPRVVARERFGADAGWVAWMKRRVPAALYELLEFAYGLWDFLRLYGAALRHRPDALYERYNLYTLGGLWVKRLCRLPLVLEVNSPVCARRAEYDGIALARFAKWTENAVWRGADRVLPVTRVLADILERDGVAPERIAVVPNGIDPAAFSGAPARQAAKAALGVDGATVLGFVGFMRDWHGLDRLIERLRAAERDDWRLLIIGDGPARERLQALAGADPRIRFLGLVERDALPRHLAAFDIALQPDVVEYASPLKLFEYLYMGCAVVAPDRANLREVLRHEDNALLCPAGDGAALLAAVERLLDDPVLRARLGRAARATIENRRLYWSENARRVEALFHELGAGVAVAEGGGGR